MKHWQETSQIVGRVTELAAAGRRAALATVVRIEGSAYRRAGAKLLVEESGATRGGVSGGCLEADVREVALGVMREGAPRLRHYETGGDDRTIWGLGLGCNGSVDIFVQTGHLRGQSWTRARHVRTLLAGDAPFAVSTLVRGPAAVLGRMLVAGDGRAIGSTGSSALDRVIARRAEALVAAGASECCYDIEPAGADRPSTEVFTEVHVPPPRARHLRRRATTRCPWRPWRRASQVGFRVTSRPTTVPAYLSAERFPGAERIDRRPADGPGRAAASDLAPMSVVMTHSFAHDRDWGRAPAADRGPLHRPARPPRPAG